MGKEISTVLTSLLKSRISEYCDAAKNLLLIEPHIFITAELSLREIRDKGCKDVSIVITGESGSGKTIAARILSDYYSATSSSVGRGRLVEQQVPESNAIMEYFGNAQTELSVNSSRFAKLTKIFFDSSCRIIGAAQQSYMLEKSRVTSRHQCERNYHCFYAMLAGMPQKEKDKYFLKDVDFYDIIRVKQKCHLHDLIDDVARYKEFNLAISLFSQKAELMDGYSRILSALLWLGNVKISAEGESNFTIKNPDAVKTAANMLGVSYNVLDDMLRYKTLHIESKSETTKSPYTPEQALIFRDTLIRTIYNELFTLIISKLNETLAPKVPHAYNITVVDAFGFESFELNSLEQMCINHANERLYTNFLDTVINADLKIFEEEGIGKINLTIPDYSQYMYLLQDKVNGIFSIINDQCNFPRASDKTTVDQIKKVHNTNSHFKYIIDAPDSFVIKHYAGDVNYNVNGFLEKSRLRIHTNIVDLMKSSSIPFLREFFSVDLAPSGSQKSVSIGHRFCRQLDELIAELEKSKVFYIKCIRSNYEFTPLHFDYDAVASQLVSSGIPQALDVRRSVFPVKHYYKDIAQNYYLLLKYEDRVDINKNPISTAKKILMLLNLHDKCVMGRTLVLLDSVSGCVLEDARYAVITKSAITIQKYFKAFLTRRQYYRLKKAALILQSATRGMLARRYVARLHQCALKIQTVWRSVLAKRVYAKLKNEYEALERQKLAEKQKLLKEERLKKQRAEEEDKKLFTAASIPPVSTPIKSSKPITPPQITTQSLALFTSKTSIPTPPQSVPVSMKTGGNLKEISDDLISTIHSSMSSAAPSRSSELGYDYNTYRTRTYTFGFGGAKNNIAELSLFDMTTTNIDSPENQLENYAKEYVNLEKKNHGYSVKDLMFKHRYSLEDTEAYITPKTNTASVPILSFTAADPELSKISGVIFKYLLKFSTLGPKGFDSLFKMLEIGVNNMYIRDEIYFQIIRQTNTKKTYDPAKSSYNTMENYWFACYAVCSSFPPSQDLFMHAICYFLRCARIYKDLNNTISKYIQASALTVRKLYTFGARKIPLSLRELGALQIKSACAGLCVNLASGSSIKCKIYSHSRVSEILSHVFYKFGFRSQSKWGLFLKTNDVDVPLYSDSYIYDEIYEVMSYVTKDKREIIDCDISEMLVTAKRVVFDNTDTLELLNPILSESLMMQISSGIWYSSVFMDHGLLLELLSLSLAYQANETKIYLEKGDQFMLKIRSQLPSVVVQNLPKSAIDDAYRVYQSNKHIGKEIIIRKYLNLALVRNDIHSLLYDGVDMNTGQKCALTMSPLGVSIVNVMHRKIVKSIGINLLVYCEMEDHILYLHSIKEEVPKGLLTFCSLELDVIETVNARMVLEELDKFTNQSDRTVNLLRRIFNFPMEELNEDIMKARAALIDNNIIRSMTIEEENSYNQYLMLSNVKTKFKGGSYNTWRNTLFRRKNKQLDRSDSDTSSLLATSSQQIQHLTVNLSPSSCLWINFPLKLKKPLTTGRVPASWSIELWNFFKELGTKSGWINAVKDVFLKLCFGAPQDYVDELYIILARVTTGEYVDYISPDNVYAYRLWTFFFITVSYLCPSSLVYNYVHAHVRAVLRRRLDQKEISVNKITSVIDQCRKNLQPNHPRPRRYPPSFAELGYAITIFYVIIGMRFFTLNDVSIVRIKPLTTFEKLTQIAIDQSGLRGASISNYAIYKRSADGWFLCPNEEYVCDSIVSSNRINGEGSENSDIFVIRRNLQSQSCENIKSTMEKYKYVCQIISDICCSLLPTPASLDFAKIAAYFIQYKHGDFTLNTPNSYYDTAYNDYVPQSVRDSKKVLPSTIKGWHMALTLVTKDTVINTLALMLSKWKLHNAVLFDVEQEHDLKMDRKCVLAVLADEILINPSPDGVKFEARIALSDVTDVFDYEDSVIVIYTENRLSSKAVFGTNRHSELSSSIRVFAGLG